MWFNWMTRCDSRMADMRTVMGKTFKLLGVREGMGVDQPVAALHAPLDIPPVTDTGLPVAFEDDEEDCDCDRPHALDQDAEFLPADAGHGGAGHGGAGPRDEQDDEDGDEDEDVAAVRRPPALGRVRRDDVLRIAGPRAAAVVAGDKLANTRVRSYGVAYYQSQYATRPDTMDVTEVHPRRAFRDTRRAQRADSTGGRHGHPTGPELYRGRHRYFRG